MIDSLNRHGYFLGSSGQKILVGEAIASLEDFGSPVQRMDVVTSRSDICGGDIKYAVMGRFDYHSDGCFIPVPPRYIIIELIKAETGGALYLLDCHNISFPSPEKKFKFGLGEQYIIAPVRIALDEIEVFRYRKDYMSYVEKQDVDELEALHRAVEGAEGTQIALGELREGEYVVIDNWRMLHARGNFSGERTIKRYWLD